MVSPNQLSFLSRIANSVVPLTKENVRAELKDWKIMESDNTCDDLYLALSKDNKGILVGFFEEFNDNLILFGVSLCLFDMSDRARNMIYMAAFLIHPLARRKTIGSRLFKSIVCYFSTAPGLSFKSIVMQIEPKNETFWAAQGCTLLKFDGTQERDEFYLMLGVTSLFTNTKTMVFNFK